MKTSYELVLRRAKKELRQNPLKKGDRVLVLDDKTSNSDVAAAILKDIIKGMPVKITKSSKPSAKSRFNKIILPNSLEDECEELLRFIFDKEKMKKYPKNTIKLLKNIKADEIEKIAKAKKIKPKRKKAKKSRIKIMLDALEKRYPNYKFSLLNSRKEFESL